MAIADAPDRVVIPYCPRAVQQAIHEAIDRHRFVVVVAHRRLGKTVSAINECIRQAVISPLRAPRAYYIAPTRVQAKAVAWDYLMHYSDPIPGREASVSELRIDFAGRRVGLAGADNPDSLRGLYADLVVLDETGMMQARTWTEVVRPMLSDRSGKAVFIGTPNGRNLFYDLREQARKGGEWALLEFKASETGILSPEELASARGSMSEDEYMQEYECSFEASVRGAVYAKEMLALRNAGQVTSVPYDGSMLVRTAWDLGMRGSTCIIFFQVSPGGEVRIIDYHEASGEGLAYYAAMLERKPYQYGKHYAPHDIQVREIGPGISRIEQARKLGITFTPLPIMGLHDGINAVRAAFPRIWMDAVKTAPLQDCLQSYRWRHNERLDEYSGTPEHDWASHGADALRMLVQSLGAGERKWAPIKYSNVGIV